MYIRIYYTNFSVMYLRFSSSLFHFLIIHCLLFLILRNVYNKSYHIKYHIMRISMNIISYIIHRILNYNRNFSHIAYHTSAPRNYYCS